MKKTILAIAVLAATVSFSCKEDAASKIKQENVEIAAERDANADKFPVMTFEEVEHDFGIIKQGEHQETTFKFKNTGDVPLIVSNVKSTCGCTVPKKPEAPVQPGEEGEIKVTFNGSGKNQVTKRITVTANTEKMTQTLTIKAFVESTDGNITLKK